MAMVSVTGVGCGAMNVGDVIMEPDGEQLHVVYMVVSDNEFLTLPVPRLDLLKWHKLPEASRPEHAVGLEQHSLMEVATWKFVTRTEMGIARRWAFGDPNLTVLPVSVPA